MTGLIIRWAVTFVAVLVTTFILPQVQFTNLTALAIFAAVLAILNAVVKPIVTMLTCPLMILTLGLFSLVINALMFLLAANLVLGSPSLGLLDALLATIIVSIVSTLVSNLVD